MQYIKRIWRYLLTEPGTWLFYCFFQPTLFANKIEQTSPSKRAVPMLRLALPTFLFAYPFALLVRLLLFNGPDPDVMSFLLTTAQASVLGVAWGVVWGITGGLAKGITAGIAAGMAVGAAGGTALDFTRHLALVVPPCLAGALTGSVVGRVVGHEVGRIVRPIVVGLTGGIAGGVVGIVVGVEGNLGESIIAGIVAGIFGGIMGNIVGGIGENVAKSARVGLAKRLMGLGAGFGLGIMGGLAGIFLLGFGWGLGNVENSPQPVIPLGIGLGIALGTGVGITVGIAFGSALRVRSAIVLGAVLGIAFGIALSTDVGIRDGLVGGIAEVLAFIAGYILGYYRLLLYPFSSLSSLTAYLGSQRNPTQVFTYLHRSSLYWDEYVYFPLPHLKRILLIAADQNFEQAEEEIAFIAAHRRQQIGAARAASLELAIRDLEMRESLRDIAHAYQQLTEIMPHEAGLIDPRWITLFTQLKDASKDAARYYSPLGWQARRKALEDIMLNLRKAYPGAVFRDTTLNSRMREVVAKWVTVVQNEQERLEHGPEESGQIDNPYNSGSPLKLRDSLFVGRRDLVQQLEEDLNKECHVAFLLNGERRMGKSSLLYQLPNLLSAHYLTIVFDLQSRGNSSSAAALLSTIAQGIYKGMSVKAMQPKKLEYGLLREASRENEELVYSLFDEWLKSLVRMLERRRCTLLLAFDEFEKLAEAGRDRYLDLPLLLNWFRRVIQHYSHVAFLFSGVRTFGEVGRDWEDFFVGAHSLKVSFLQPGEARQLITQPVPDFPSEEIFGEGVVDEIIRVTGCHPFLVQAVCSALIDDLNTDRSSRAGIGDVDKAVDQVLESLWAAYFRDLWKRTDYEQRACLLAIRNLGEADAANIARQSDLEEPVVHCTLQTLLKRDLVLQKNGNYRIAAPIFGYWVKRSSYI